MHNQDQHGSERSGSGLQLLEILRYIRGKQYFVINDTLPRHPIATETVKIKLVNAQPPDQIPIRRIDSNHANAKQRWQEMGSPEYPSAAAVAEPHRVSRCEPESQPFDVRESVLGFDVILPPLSLVAITFQFVVGGRG